MIKITTPQLGPMESEGLATFPLRWHDNTQFWLYLLQLRLYITQF